MSFIKELRTQHFSLCHIICHHLYLHPSRQMFANEHIVLTAPSLCYLSAPFQELKHQSVCIINLGVELYQLFKHVCSDADLTSTGVSVSHLMIKLPLTAHCTWLLNKWNVVWKKSPLTTSFQFPSDKFRVTSSCWVCWEETDPSARVLTGRQLFRNIWPVSPQLLPLSDAQGTKTPDS